MTAVPNFGLFRLDVVRSMRQWFATVTPVVELLPRGKGRLHDQAARSSLSAYLNLVEGAAMPLGDGRKGNQYRIAMGSLAEAVACIDAAVLLGIVAEERARPSQALAETTARLLGGLLRSVSPHSSPSSRSSSAKHAAH